MDQVKTQLKTVRSKLDQVPALQKAEVSQVEFPNVSLVGDANSSLSFAYWVPSIVQYAFFALEQGERVEFN